MIYCSLCVSLTTITAFSQTTYTVDFETDEPNAGFGDPLVDNNILFTITPNGEIITENDEEHGVYINGGGDSTVINNGLLEMQGVDSYGIYFEAVPATPAGGGNIITNNSDIRFSSNGIGVYYTLSGQAVITNNATIEAIDLSTLEGVLVEDSSDVTVINHGLIDMAFVLNNPPAISLVNAPNSSIMNTGTLLGSEGGGVGVSVTGAEGYLVNSGSIFAFDETQTAIRFSDNGRNDRMVFEPGTRIIGHIIMDGDGSGADEIVLDHHGQDISWRWTFEGFDETTGDTLEVIGAPFIVERGVDSETGNPGDITVTVFNLSGETAAGYILQDVNHLITQSVASRISETQALQPSQINFNPLAYTNASSENSADNDIIAENNWSLWGKAFGGIKQRSADTASSQTLHGFGGAVIGADTSIDDKHLLGIYGGYGRSIVDFKVGSDMSTDIFFAGLYGRAQASSGFFGDMILTTGYTQGDVGSGVGSGIRTNNLVAGGIETFAGTPVSGLASNTEQASGFYIIPSLRLGTHFPLKDNVTLIPSISLSYAHQWRDSHGAGVDVEQSISLLNTRLELAARMADITPTNHSWSAELRGGLDLTRDFSHINIATGGSTVSSDVGSDELETAAYAGVDLVFSLSDTLSLNLNSEITLILSGQSDEQDLGANLSTGFSIRF